MLQGGGSAPLYKYLVYIRVAGIHNIIYNNILIGEGVGCYRVLLDLHLSCQCYAAPPPPTWAYKGH